MSHLPLSVERAAADPEQPRRPALVSPRQAQDALDVALLEGPQIRDLLLRPAAAPAASAETQPGRGSHWRSSRRIVPPWESAAAPSSRFSSSRMLPGKSWASSAAYASRSRVGHVPALARREPLQEVAHELRDVLAPLAQRRQRDLDDAQAVVEVLAELAPGDALRRAGRGSPRAPARRSGPGGGRRRARSRAPGARAGAWPGAASGMSPISSRKSVPALGRLEPSRPAPRRPSPRRARCRRARTRAASREAPRS